MIIHNRHRNELILLLSAIAFVGFGESCINSTLNNFLNDTYQLTGIQRTLLEIPRETPGLLVVFISALLYFLRSRRLAVFASLIGSLGLAGMAFFPNQFNLFCAWIFLYSTGQHLLMPLSTSIGMELARSGQDGKRLGQINSIRNTATILGSFLIILGFKSFHFNYKISFLIAAIAYFSSSMFFYLLKPGHAHTASTRLKLYKEYKLYYWLAVLFGTRKQLFLTFAPWVLVTVYGKPTTVIATLLTVGGIAGIFFQPLLGQAIDKLGEKRVLQAEALLLMAVCLGYGYAKLIMPINWATIVVYCLFVTDQLLMSVNMARSTYLKKIVTDPAHITPTLTMSVSMDHVFSISVALLGGLVWQQLGYQYVFAFGGLLAGVNLWSAMRIRLPQGHATS